MTLRILKMVRNQITDGNSCSIIDGTKFKVFNYVCSNVRLSDRAKKRLHLFFDSFKGLGTDHICLVDPGYFVTTRLTLICLKQGSNYTVGFSKEEKISNLSISFFSASWVGLMFANFGFNYFYCFLIGVLLFGFVRLGQNEETVNYHQTLNAIICNIIMLEKSRLYESESQVN
jgi:hypothetical protein